MTTTTRIPAPQGPVEDGLDFGSFRPTSLPTYSGESLAYSARRPQALRPQTAPPAPEPATEVVFIECDCLQPQTAPSAAEPDPRPRWQPLRPREVSLRPAVALTGYPWVLGGSGPTAVSERVVGRLLEPPWLEIEISQRLRQRLIELSALRPGWDGENALPPRPDALANAVATILVLQAALPEFEEPFVVPTIDGFTQLEWYGQRRALELEGTASGWSIVGSETTLAGEHVYHQADATRLDVGKLIAAFRWFAGLELVWPIS